MAVVAQRLGVRCRRPRSRRRGPRSGRASAARLATRRVGVRAPALLCGLVVLTACGRGGGAPRERAARGRWVASRASRASLELPDGAHGLAPGPELHQVIAVPGGWAALGTTDGRELAAWRSRDGVHWRLTQHEAARDSSGVNTIVRRGTDLVAAGRSGDAPAVWVSRDDGRAWTRVRSAALGADGSVGDATVVRDRVVLVGSRGSSTPTPAAWVMRDAAHVARSVVSGTGPYDAMSDVVDLGGRLLAVGSVASKPATWRSRDDGAHWERVPVTAPGRGGRLQEVVALGGRLVASGDSYGANDAPAGYVWLASADAREWRPVPRHSGSFGDGNGTRVGPLLGFRGAALMAGEVEDRASPNFCYDDLATCDVRSPALWLSADGRVWGRVAVPGATGYDQFSTIAADASGFLLVGTRFHPERSASDVRVWRWTGPPGTRPDSRVPPEERFATPRYELIESYDARLEIGRTYRFVVPIGGPCGAGRLDFNATRWKVVQPLGEAPYPKDWPVRHMEVADAPTDYLYGTVRVVDDRHLQVGIENGAVLRTYEPTNERLLPCG